MTTAGLLHSDICGSMAICASPQLFAAYRVLRRQISPRHPPYALSILAYVTPLLFQLLSFSWCVRILSREIFLTYFFYAVFKEHPLSGIGGDEENRTPDPLLARQVLSQLSYAPIGPLSVCRLLSSDVSDMDKVLPMLPFHVRLISLQVEKECGGPNWT